MPEIIRAEVIAPNHINWLTRPIALDAQNFAMLGTVDQYLTPEDWADAAATGRVPGVLGPQAGRIFARAFGSGPVDSRWYSLTPAEAAGDSWPSGVVPMCSRVSGRLTPGGGQDCERALAWCMERDCRIPPAWWRPGEPIPAVRGPFPVPVANPAADFDPEACEDAPAPSPQSERMRAMLHDQPPVATARPEYTWRHPVALLGWGLLVLLALALSVGAWS